MIETRATLDDVGHKLEDSYPTPEETSKEESGLASEAREAAKFRVKSNHTGDSIFPGNFAG